MDNENEKKVKENIKIIQSNPDNDKKTLAIENVLNQFEPFRKSLVKRFANKGVDFDDICQQIDLKMIEALYDYDENKDPSAIRHITSRARNGLFNFYKKEMNYFKEERKEISIEQHVGYNEIAGNNSWVEYFFSEIPDENEIIDKIVIDSEIEKLTERQKEILLMFYIDDIKQDEIAERLEIDQSNVSRAIKRGVEKLKGSLNPSDEHDDMI